MRVRFRALLVLGLSAGTWRGLIGPTAQTVYENSGARRRKGDLASYAAIFSLVAYYLEDDTGFLRGQRGLRPEALGFRV